ncbi:MAG: cobalamin-dependent protein, partial [bacterium]|nr:cobalamin-dependent protein [bacterium]
RGAVIPAKAGIRSFHSVYSGLMKILLVQAYTGRKEFGLIYPVGLAYLAAALTTDPYHHEVRIIDPNTESDPYGSLSETMQTFLPNVVGISQRNIDTTQIRDLYIYLKTLQPTLQLVRRLAPEAITVVGGSGFSLFPEKIMERIPEIEFGVYQEAEESFPELVAKLGTPEQSLPRFVGVKGIYYRKNGTILFTGPRIPPDFDQVPPPRHDLTQIQKYFTSPVAIGVQSKRGCPLKCVYCSYPHLNGPLLRVRNPKSVVDEIELLTKQEQIPEYMFVDSVFNIPKPHAEAVCQELIARNLTAVKWTAFFDIKNMDAEFIQLAKKAGCSEFAFSPDALTDRALKALRKNFSEQEVRNTLVLFKKTPGVRVGYSFFVSTPGLTVGGYLKTLWYFLKENLLLVPRRKGGIGLSWIRIEPYTELERIAIAEKIITPETELLPQTEQELKSLFYLNPRLKLLDYISQRILDFMNLASRIWGRRMKHG